MVAPKDTYLGGTTATAMKNKVYTCRKIYYDKDTHLTIKQSVKDFYSRFLFKIYAIPQDEVVTLDIAATFFINSSSDISYFLV